VVRPISPSTVVPLAGLVETRLSSQCRKMKQVVQVEAPRVDTDQASVSSKHQKLAVSVLVTAVMKESFCKPFLEEFKALDLHQ
jgi:hypothetical protein